VDFGDVLLKSKKKQKKSRKVIIEKI